MFGYMKFGMQIDCEYSYCFLFSYQLQNVQTGGRFKFITERQF